MNETTRAAANILKRLWPGGAVRRCFYSLDVGASTAVLQIMATRGLTYHERTTLLGQVRAVVRLAKHRGQDNFDLFDWTVRKLRDVKGSRDGR